MQGNESFGRASLARGFATLCATLIVAAPAGALAVPTETALYAFKGGPGSDGRNPYASLIADSNGNLYGTTYNGGASNAGTAFELTPPAITGGAWTETVLHAFTGGSDGRYPQGSLILDNKGNLYGTTTEGGASNVGTVFELRPPATTGGAWTETVLYAFTGDSFTGGSDGAVPRTGLIADSNGNLHGTTALGGASNAGTVFELTPPAITGGAWTETVLHAFTGGSDGRYPGEGNLILDNKGNLYGTTFFGGASNIGTVFELMRPAIAGGAWTEAVLYAFTGGSNGSYPSGLIADSNGNLYGTTEGGGASDAGTVFELMRPAIAGGAWTETVRHAFTGGSDGAGPDAGLIADSKGTLFGTTLAGGASNVGTIFLLTPPANAFEVWREAVLYAFTGGSNGSYPSGLIADSNGNLYGTTETGGASDAGTVFELTGTGLPLPIRICAPCRSPPICCACAGGIWTGKECI
jgi:uncharacterized repeat protein (TIGR03803 family)